MLIILGTVGVLGAVSVAGWSVLNIGKASRKLCNGEQKQLARLERTVGRFHKHAHAAVFVRDALHKK